MSRFALVLLALVALTCAGIFFFAARPAQTVIPAPAVASKEVEVSASLPTFTAPAPVPAPAPAELAPVAERTELVKKPDDPDPFAAERKTIRALAESGDPAQVPALARYLGRSEATLRKEACLGLIVLGDRSAIPFLEAAANNPQTTPEEVTGLQEAVRVLTGGF